MDVSTSIAKRIRTHIKFTEPARVAMRDDDLTAGDILRAIRNFEVLEKYPDAKPFASCLLLCWLKDESPLHVACALPESVDMLIIVTVYKPSKSEWSDQRRRRR